MADDATVHARHLLSSLPRCDQRRWAEVFIRGLMTVPGRKTIKKISGYVAEGGAEQCLQQFVNQSTWRWDTVRRDLALRLASQHEPRAWVIQDVVLAKNGNNSVGVARQFAHPVGRVLNCQLGLAVFMAGHGWSCPVNWRLMLPLSWDEDKDRRRKAHLPDDEHCLPRGQHMLDIIDEMTTEWELRPSTIVADARNEQQLDPLLRGMEERRLPYAIQVAPSQSALTVRSPGGTPQAMSFGQIITESVARNTAAVNVWQLPVGRQGRIQLIAARLPAHAWPPSGGQRRPAGPRYVAAEWSPARRSPRATWVTSLDPAQLAGLLEGIALLDQTAADLNELYDGLGLGHFEGRSFTGWHHYVTLVSIAHACRQLYRMES
jgi:SRSO17 transposase